MMGGIASPNPMMAPPVMNPILAELDAAHSSLSPDAQQAIERAHGIAAPAGIAAPNGPPLEPPPGGGIQAPAPTTVGAGITPPGAESPKLTAPSVDDNVSSAAIKPAGALAVPSLGSKIPEAPVSHIGGQVSPELTRITKPDTGQHNKQNTGTSGINQIHNPWARVPLQILDALGRGFFPGVEMAIPGTSGHHDVLVHQRQVEDTQERDAANDEAKRAQETASAEHLTAEAEGLKNPKDKQATNMVELFQKDPALFTKYQEATQKAAATREPQLIRSEGASGKIIGLIGSDLKFHSADDPNIDPEAKKIIDASKEKPPSSAQGEIPLGERVSQINAALKARYQVLHPGKELPEHYVLPTEATQKDFDRTDKLIEGEERAFGTKANQDQTLELRKQTMALANQNREHKTDTDTKKAAYKAFEPAMDSAERFNVMTKNYEDAVKNHDQQAMLSLLANHLGMTMGLQKGSRLTKDIINEAKVSRPYLQGLQANFDKDGYLSGVNLTPPQMRQMINLGRERFSEDIMKGRSQAHYMGAEDDGPERTPSNATVNHYVSLAKGDKTKAKQLLSEDGWSIGK